MMVIVVVVFEFIFCLVGIVFVKVKVFLNVFFFKKCKVCWIIFLIFVSFWGMFLSNFVKYV